MDVITLEAKPREPGKKGARTARREKEVPCVLYGHHVDPVAFQVPELALSKLIFTGEAHLVQVKLDGNSWECVLKDIDLHPVTDRPIHADFQVLQRGEKITLMVPIRFHGTPVGQTEGGDTQYVIHEMEITCLPKDIPSVVDIDVSALKIGDSIHISDLEIEGVEFGGVSQQTVVTVVAPRLAVVEEEVTAEGELLGEEEEGAEEGEEAGETEEEA